MAVRSSLSKALRLEPQDLIQQFSELIEIIVLSDDIQKLILVRCAQPRDFAYDC